jgi:holo-[acyl-carrier protein] synthase
MIGIDIVEIDRMQPDRKNACFFLTDEEEHVYEALHTIREKKTYLASRFAVKEAVFKATQDPEYLSYTVLNKENGQPFIKGHPEIEVSISHDAGIAIAMVSVHQK